MWECLSVHGELRGVDIQWERFYWRDCDCWDEVRVKFCSFSSYSLCTDSFVLRIPHSASGHERVSAIEVLKIPAMYKLASLVTLEKLVIVPVFVCALCR